MIIINSSLWSPVQDERGVAIGVVRGVVLNNIIIIMVQNLSYVTLFVKSSFFHWLFWRVTLLFPVRNLVCIKFVICVCYYSNCNISKYIIIIIGE